MEVYGIGELDMVIGIAASGRTPYVVGGLRAVFAVFLAAAGLDRLQGAELHRACVVVRAVHLHGAEQQLRDWQVVERSNGEQIGRGGGRSSGGVHTRKGRVSSMARRVRLTSSPSSA